MLEAARRMPWEFREIPGILQTILRISPAVPDRRLPVPRHRQTNPRTEVTAPANGPAVLRNSVTVLRNFPANPRTRQTNLSGATKFPGRT
jgi:hypothetical protein